MHLQAGAMLVNGRNPTEQYENVLHSDGLRGRISLRLTRGIHPLVISD